MKHFTVRNLTIALGALLLAALPVAAQELSPDEVSCMQRSSFVMASFGPRYAKCAIKCVKRVGPVLAAQQCTEAGACGLSATDATCRCFGRASSGAVRTQGFRCLDCPECYVSNGGDPNPECESDAEAKVSALSAFIESLFITGSPAVFCDDSTSLNGHSAAELKCQMTMAKALATFAKQKATCLSDCRELERAGQVAPGGCNPPILTNPNAPTTAKNCVLRWEIKAMLQIHGRCSTAEGGERPACHGTRDGSEWVDVVENFVDGEDPTYFCSFPSRAFFDQ